MARTIQFKRNTQISANAASAKQSVLGISSQLVNGEIVLNSYYDPNARGGVATLVAVKSNNDKIFFVDNQIILNKLGINDDGSINENVTGSVETLIDDIENLVGDIANGAGLSADGSYVADATDEKLSGATSLADADKKLSAAIKEIEEIIGTGGAGGSIVDKIDTISGDVETVAADVETISGDVETIGGNVDTLSGKTVTDVEDTATIDFTKEANSADGTQKIKADVKISASNGNILSAATDGLYTSVDYNAATNALVVNGVEKPLNAGSIIDSIEYDSETEKLVITYSDTSGGTHTTEVDMTDLIQEYTYPAKDENHNVAFTVTRNVSGGTAIQADVSNFDCGEY